MSIQKIRRALDELERIGHSAADIASIVAIEDGGELFIAATDGAAYRVDRGHQKALPHILDLVRPYLGGRGPDLLRPRSLLRIIPGKLHGEPHLADTRIPTAAIFALHQSGFRLSQIQEMYPGADLGSLEQAIDLEQSLRHAA